MRKQKRIHARPFGFLSIQCEKCGSRSVISTNMTDAVITITCPFCKAPVNLELDRSGREYRTM